ncbi:Tyrosine-protein kinase [Trema orientale]|uniref:Tyrosine-protein kinase n=1 Tax=Trema orientale TaxID=63057 RepID=A0A2P5FDU9_TREOI|nr:Tyrosine-protein kinase [Trema orientale]
MLRGTSHKGKATQSANSGRKHVTTATRPPRGGCCRGLNDCLSMGSIISTNRREEPTSRFEQQKSMFLSSSDLLYKLRSRWAFCQGDTKTDGLSKEVHSLGPGRLVADLEREVLKQKELRITYRRRMERTQDYLRHCLQIAQENGFLDLIIQNKDAHALAPPTPQTPTPVHPHSELAALIDTAKLNGWYIAPDEIELQERIGQGSTANVHRGTWRGLDVAVKCIKPDFFTSNEKGATFFAQEVETLARQRHRFVLQLMGACLDPPNCAWAVTEFLSTTLEEWLHGPGKRPKQMAKMVWGARLGPLPPLGQRLAKALEIAQAMQYLHDQRPKVVGRCFTRTYVYMAPEVVKCEPYNEKCDVYSFGIILNELITGEYPYIEKDYGPAKIAMEVVEDNLRPRLPEYDGQLGELIDLICVLWHGDAAKRPSFAAITCILRKIQKTMLESVDFVDVVT